MFRIKRLFLGITILVNSAPAFAVQSAESTAISVNPSVYTFKEVSASSATSSASISVKNIGSGALNVGTINLSGDHADQFQIDSDACSNTAVPGGSSCAVTVKYSPTARGHKQALLNIPSDAADTPVLQAFLTSREDSYNESSRRLPPVLYSVNIPETMTSGQTYTLEWSILGYHEDYTSLLVMFDCTGIVDGSCGDNYSDATRFFSSGTATPDSNVTSPWSNGGISAKEFKFSTSFTPSFAQQTDIVVRFYRKNIDDLNAGKGSLSLVIPGNLASEYYDTDGRRIKKTISP